MTGSWKHIPAANGKKIYYLEETSASAPTKRAVILAHGLTGHAQEHIHQVAAPYFLSKGYDVYRISFYGMGEDARKLPECTLAIHAADLNALVRHIAPEYEKIFVCGHSYGGLSLLIANPDIDGAAFWDSSYIPDFWDEAVYLPPLDMYKIGWGTDNLIGKDMFEEAQTYRNRDYTREVAKEFKSPAFVALAGIGQENAELSALYDDLQVQKETQIFDGASHCFYEDDSAQELARACEIFFRSL